MGDAYGHVGDIRPGVVCLVIDIRPSSRCTTAFLAVEPSEGIEFAVDNGRLCLTVGILLRSSTGPVDRGKIAWGCLHCWRRKDRAECCNDQGD